MRTYSYKAKNKDGEIKKGSITAVNEEEAAKYFDLNELVLINLTDKDETVNFSSFQFSQRITGRELMLFSKQLSGMIGAGMPLVESLITVGEDEKNKYFSSVIMSIANDVEGGASLSSSMEKYPKIFSDIFIGMLKVGEATGKLSDTFKRLADQIEKDYQLKAQIRGAMIYPIFILVTLASVATLAMTFVFPKLMPILTAAQIELPTSTKILIFISETISKYWYLLIPGTVGIGAFLYFFTRKGEGDLLWSDLKLHIPIAGKIIKNIYMARFLRTFSILLTAGINIDEALIITSRAVGNTNYENTIVKAMENVKNGGSLAQAFEESKYFPNNVKKMIKIGESSGTLDATTGNLASYYENEVSNQVGNLTKTLEPLLVILMGIGVAFFVAAVVMPLYDATSNVNKL